MQRLCHSVHQYPCLNIILINKNFLSVGKSSRNFYLIFSCFGSDLFLRQKILIMKKEILIFCAILICFATDLQAQQDSIWTLEKCINYALEKNIQVRKSELSNQQYNYYAGQAKAQRFPSVNASVSQNFNWSKASGESGYTGMNGSNVSVNSGVTTCYQTTDKECSCEQGNRCA